jgi:putative transposase
MKPSRLSRYTRHRFPAEVISHAVWLYFRFPLSLRMVEEMLAARGIEVSHETVRQSARKFGQSFANQIRRRLPAPGDKWHLDEVVISIAGQKHWLWRAVDQHGVSSISWFRGAVTPQRPSACCASCSRSRAWPLA